MYWHWNFNCKGAQCHYKETWCFVVGQGEGKMRVKLHPVVASFCETPNSLERREPKGDGNDAEGLPREGFPKSQHTEAGGTLEWEAATQASTIGYCFGRHERCKIEEVMESSTRIPKSCHCQAMYGRVVIPKRRSRRPLHKAMTWSINYNKDCTMLEMLEHERSTKERCRKRDSAWHGQQSWEHEANILKPRQLHRRPSTPDMELWDLGFAGIGTQN